MTWLLWLGIGALLFTAASLFALWSYGRFAKKARGAYSRALPRESGATELDRLLAPLESAHPAQTGLALILENGDAYTTRALSARAAGRSLDMFYYIWRDDLTGKLLAQELLDAADRGVRVRLLLDDVNVQGLDSMYRALSAHPRIKVRLFNPIRNRGNSLRRGLEMLLGLVRFNRRMHCKAWIADGRIAVTGGRNIGDSYFGAARGKKRNSRDADVLMAGAGVAELEHVFDTYWNCGAALPIAALWRNQEEDLSRLRTRLERVAHSALAAAFCQRTLAGRSLASFLDAGRMHWDPDVKVLADPPEKTLGAGQDRWMPAVIAPHINTVQHQLKLATPYFVPGKDWTIWLTGLAAKGVTVSILTNALSATNHIAVHGAYRYYRFPLLQAGIRIFEFAPPGRDGEKGEMLHSKYFVVDDKTGFVGSFNFDLRSAFLNTEMGIIFHHPALVAELAQTFAQDTAPGQSYGVMIEGKALRWTVTDPQGPRSLAFEPEVNAFRRGLSWIIGKLPIHSYL